MSNIILKNKNYSIPTIPLTNLKMWLKSDAGITLNETTVSSWVDQSGNGNDVSQGTAESQPLYVNNVLNGKPVLRFDASDDYLVSNLFVPYLSQPNTVFIVWNTNTVSNQIIFDGYTGARNCLGYFPGYAYDLFLYSGAILSWPDFTPSDYHISTILFSGSTSALYQNGIQKISGDTGVEDMGRMIIGYAYDLSGYPLDGNIAEIIVYNSGLNTTERQQVESYLSSKYNISTPSISTSTISNSNIILKRTQITNTYTAPTSNLSMWLKSDAGITLNGSYVSSWIDQSTNENIISQETAESQPLYVSNALNGYPVVRFDGINDVMYTSAFTQAQPLTVFIVAKTTKDTSFFFDCSSRVVLSIYSPGYTMYAGNWMMSTLPNPLPYSILTAIFNSSSSEVFLNGISNAIGDPGATGFNNFILGDASGSGGQLGGDIAEIMIYDGVLSESIRKQTESYLSNKYFTSTTQNQNIIYRSTLYNPPPPPPIPQTNLKMWLRADSGITLNSSYVSSWTDQSTNGYILSQGTAASQPLYVPNALNDKPVLRFDGGDDFLKELTFSCNQPSTYFMVWKCTDHSNQALIIDTDYNVARNVIFYWESSYGIGLSAGGVLNDGYTFESDFVLSSVVFNGASSELFEYGVSGVTGNAGSQNASAFNIGSDWTNKIQFLTGDVAEIIVYETILSPTDRLQVETYLVNKYGL